MNDVIADCLIGRPGLLPGTVMDDNSKSDNGGERVAKVIARAGLASRREAEAWIAAGRVAVNGAVIRSPALNVTAGDGIDVDGKPLPARERTRLFLYHKPRGLMTSHSDPQGRPTVFQGLPKHLPRLISAGRLDFNTEGLLLLSNDGALARVLELPATGWLRRYRVRAHGSVTQVQLDELHAGVTVDGVRYEAIEATLDRVQGSNLWLTFAIREGKNREVRNVLGHLGLMVTRLIRISFGPFQLRELAEGAVEEVPTRVLRDQLGERLMALAGADFSAPIAKQADTSRDLPRHSEAAAKRPSKKERQGRRPRSGKSDVEKFRADGRTRRPAAQADDEDKSESRRTIRPRPASPAHSWRRHEEDRPGKKLRRKFRGARRQDNKPGERSAEKPRAGLLTDRKGRRVLVERFGRNKPPQESKSVAPKRGRQGRRDAPDRVSGARPRHPRRR
jgi:23S rRNA pseudouridine2605 synthase